MAALHAVMKTSNDGPWNVRRWSTIVSNMSFNYSTQLVFRGQNLGFLMEYDTVIFNSTVVAWSKSRVLSPSTTSAICKFPCERVS